MIDAPDGTMARYDNRIGKGNRMSTTLAPPQHVIRTGEKGEPTLIVSTTANYGWIYSDAGSGAHMDVTIYRPYPTDPGVYCVGDYAQGNYSSPSGVSITVKAVNDDPSHPLLAAPLHYNEIWNDHGSGGDHDGSIWYPVPPDGYVSLGFVCNGGYDQPNIPTYRCVRRDLTEATQAGPLIWNDQGSGAHMDVSLWQLVGVPNAFLAQGNYNPYTGPAFKLKGFSG
jgi:Vacuolar protein sorting-associated protein 62